MKVLLISATQAEIQPYLLHHSPHHDILITGVGIHSATYEITQQLLHHHYDLVVQAGIAGASGHGDYKPGDVLAVKQDAFGDFGSIENGAFLSAQQLNLTNEREWLVNDNEVINQVQLPLVNAITVGTVGSEPQWNELLYQKWQADIETMEGAALHFVCNRRQVPYVQIRAISNFIGDRNRENWSMELAIGNLNGALGALMGFFQ
jgi:futalosine hydrolase